MVTQTSIPVTARVFTRSGCGGRRSLASLNEIDAKLAEPFPGGKRAVFHKFGRHMIGTGETAYLGEWGSLDARPIDNCSAYLKWTDEGYRHDNSDEDSHWVYRMKGGYCLALRALKRALPIRLTPMTATCRVPPLSRVKLGIGWSRGVARDAGQ